MPDHEQGSMQQSPVKVYRSENRLTVAAPMAGLQPEDITVEVTDAKLVLHGALRGELKGEKEVIRDEWNPGPYHREIKLPSPVDAEHANVTFSNGVLVVSLPITEQTSPARLQPDQGGQAHGVRQGWSGGGAGTGGAMPS